MNIWMIMLAGGLLTFGMRLSFIYLLGRVDVPEAVRRALRFVPPAVLSALILPELLMPVVTSTRVWITVAGWRVLLPCWLPGRQRVFS